jgi:type II secretory pathway component PulF
MSRNTELASYTRQLAFLTGRGISLGDAIVNTCGDIKDKHLRCLFLKIRQAQISSPLENNLFQQLSIVYPLYASEIIRQASRQEKLPAALVSIADNMDKEEEIRQDVEDRVQINAMPVNAGLFLIFIISTMILPIFTGSFDHSDVDIPFHAQVILFFSKAFSQTSFVIVYFLVILGINYFLRFKTITENPIYYYFPVLKEYIKAFYKYRTAVWLPTILEYGISIEEAFLFLESSVPFRAEKQKLRKLMTEITQGIDPDGVPTPVMDYLALFRKLRKHPTDTEELGKAFRSYAGQIRAGFTFIRTEEVEEVKVGMTLLLTLLPAMIVYPVLKVFCSPMWSVFRL